MGPFDIAAAPVLGPLQVIQRLGRKIIEIAEVQAYDPDRLLTEIIRLQVQYDMGKLSQEKYFRKHSALVRRVNVARKYEGESGDLPGPRPLPTSDGTSCPNPPELIPDW